ncbi:MAG TPA: AzlC family ABC transporter permease [Lachnospiraceae bacterium]|nr:AzlC family ABC transporter permease [Lachnospiraceae bacterium]
MKTGFRDGIAIGIGYFSVSFTFGIMAISFGFSWWQTVIISMVNLTSAGQFAGIGIMAASGSYMEMLIAQLTINLRYSIMSISLSQKVDRGFRGIFRWILGFGITDEIFAVAMSRNEMVSRGYFSGLLMMPYLGWTLGTLTGAICGEVLPSVVRDALGIALYGMFIAILIPKIRVDRRIRCVAFIAVLMSCCFRYIPLLKGVSIGFAVTICAIVASVIGAILFPVNEEVEA